MDRNWYRLETPTEAQLQKMSYKEIQVWYCCAYCGLEDVSGGQTAKMATYQCGKCLCVYCDYCQAENHRMDDCVEDWPIRVKEKE